VNNELGLWDDKANEAYIALHQVNISSGLSRFGEITGIVICGLVIT
jgi:hypothetical protein